MSGPGFHDHTDETFAQATEDWLRHELKGMESNDLLDVAHQGNKKWDDLEQGDLPKDQSDASR